jgi:putative ABC transport system permease protein
MPTFRYAVRSLARNPLFTVVAIVSLALALAVNTTVFAVIDALVHPVVPYRDGGRALSISYMTSVMRSSTLEERYEAIRNGFHSAETIVPYFRTATSIQTGNTIEDTFAATVPSEIFGILGIRPAVGRAFNATDTTRTALPVVMISYELWLRLFHGQPLQKRLTLTVGRGNYNVIGVMPRGMHFASNDVWLPEGKLVGDSSTKPLGPYVLVRLRPGVTQASAKNELAVVAAGLNAAVAPRLATGFLAISFASGSGGGPRVAGWSAMAMTVATVLLIACANLGTMLLARGMARRRETAIRIALGASRRVIASQVLAECALIVGAGVALGIVLTLWAVYLLPHYMTPFVQGFGDLDPVPSWRVFLFAAMIAGATVALAGALPALRAAATDPAEPIKDGSGATGRVRDRYNPLIIVEVALSTGLLMTAALFIMAVSRLVGFDFSYAAKQLQVVTLNARTLEIPSDTAVERFYDDLVSRVRTVPGVRDAATARAEKPVGPYVFSEQGLNGERWISLGGYSVVSPTYLATLGIPIDDGRDFQPGDRGTETGVVIVDDSAARRLWPDLRSPVGRMIRLGGRDSKRPWLRVVGVARSVEMYPRSDLDLPPEPQIYVVYGHDNERGRDLVVRGDGVGGADAQAALGVRVRHAIEAGPLGMRVPSVHRWLQGYDSTRQTAGFLASLFTAFGGFGLLLCGVGLYGVLAYAVSRRLRELATRIALGAQSRDVVRLVLHDAAVTVLAGIGIGAFVALAATHSFADSLLNIHYELALALLAAEAMLLGVAMLACLGPVRQAIRANPVEILRAS